MTLVLPHQDTWLKVFLENKVFANSLFSLFSYLQSQFLLSLQAISIMVHFYMGTKGPENVSIH